MDIHEHAVFANYFLICNGENDRQLRALADSIKENAKKQAHVTPLSMEGEPETGWMLVDYGDLIVHIFSPEKRSYYNLEGLWNNAYPVLRMQ